jgi:hypothetical protein
MFLEISLILEERFNFIYGALAFLPPSFLSSHVVVRIEETLTLPLRV